MMRPAWPPVGMRVCVCADEGATTFETRGASGVQAPRATGMPSDDPPESETPAAVVSPALRSHSHKEPTRGGGGGGSASSDGGSASEVALSSSPSRFAVLRMLLRREEAGCASTSSPSSDTKTRCHLVGGVAAAAAVVIVQVDGSEAATASLSTSCSRDASKVSLGRVCAARTCRRRSAHTYGCVYVSVIRPWDAALGSSW